MILRCSGFEMPCSSRSVSVRILAFESSMPFSLNPRAYRSASCFGNPTCSKTSYHTLASSSDSSVWGPIASSWSEDSSSELSSGLADVLASARPLLDESSLLTKPKTAPPIEPGSVSLLARDPSGACLFSTICSRTVSSASRWCSAPAPASTAFFSTIDAEASFDDLAGGRVGYNDLRCPPFTVETPVPLSVRVLRRFSSTAGGVFEDLAGSLSSEG
mmetsp:Transcript_8400/g.15413  ORF Transcript_8400/g.15413 Transcript_8400/m.15413 type:complete len:217 (-) Transcript_8400:266-916(-)